MLELNTYNDREMIKNKKIAVRSKELPTNISYVSKPQRTFDKVILNIIEQKLYLNPNLTLENVAQACNISSGYLSQLISEYSEQSFNGLINSFRIDEAKEMLRNPDFNKYTAAAIGLEAGFNSKSTFFAAFKKHTGTSPNSYKSS